VTWASNMKTDMALSTTEAELIAMSDGLRTAITLMNFLEELADQGVSMFNKIARAHYRVFKDNSAALAIATLPKIRACTKPINEKYWHFSKYVEQCKIMIHAVTTQQQIADLLTSRWQKGNLQQLKEKSWEMVLVEH